MQHTNQITPPKLRRVQPSSPPPPPPPLGAPHTLSALPPTLSSVSWARGMLRYCLPLRERSAWWGCPRLTCWFQVQTEATGSRGCGQAIFLVLSPFQSHFLRFLSVPGAVEVIREPAGRMAEPHGPEPLSAQKVGLKWAELWLMEGNYTWNWKKWKGIMCYNGGSCIQKGDK